MRHGVPVCVYMCVQYCVSGERGELCVGVGVFGIVVMSSFKLCGHQ